MRKTPRLLLSLLVSTDIPPTQSLSGAHTHTNAIIKALLLCLTCAAQAHTHTHTHAPIHLSEEKNKKDECER